MSSVRDRADRQEQALDELGREIVDGTVAAGYRYTIDGMQDRFSLTRSSGRDVMHQLEVLGLVTPRRSVGVVVNPQDQWNVGATKVIRWRLSGRRATQQFGELAMLRAGVEPLAAAGAALHAPLHVRQRLMELGEFMVTDRAAAQPRELLEADAEFHMLLLRYSGNSIFASFGALVRETARERGRQGIAPFKPSEPLAQAHLDVARAIMDGECLTAELHAGPIAEDLRDVAGVAPALAAEPGPAPSVSVHAV